MKTTFVLATLSTLALLAAALPAEASTDADAATSFPPCSASQGSVTVYEDHIITVVVSHGLTCVTVAYGLGDWFSCPYSPLTIDLGPAGVSQNSVVCDKFVWVGV